MHRERHLENFHGCRTDDIDCSDRYQGTDAQVPCQGRARLRSADLPEQKYGEKYKVNQSIRCVEERVAGQVETSHQSSEDKDGKHRKQAGKYHIHLRIRIKICHNGHGPVLLQSPHPAISRTGRWGIPGCRTCSTDAPFFNCAGLSSDRRNPGMSSCWFS